MIGARQVYRQTSLEIKKKDLRIQDSVVGKFGVGVKLEFNFNMNLIWLLQYLEYNSRVQRYLNKIDREKKIYQWVSNCALWSFLMVWRAVSISSQ